MFILVLKPLFRACVCIWGVGVGGGEGLQWLNMKKIIITILRFTQIE